MSQPELSTFDVIHLMTGYQPAAALTAAARLGVFDAVADGPRSATDVAAALGSEPAATLALLDTLVGLSLLTLTGDGYGPTRASARLTASGDLRLVAEKEAFLAGVWLQLEESVRSGRPRLDTWAQRLAHDPDQAHTFLQALVVLARETGPDLTKLPGVESGARVADLGGGLGAYAVPLAGAGARVTLADLPVVAGWAHEELADLDPTVRSRVAITPVDLLSTEAAATLGGSFDIVLLSHLLHDLDDADCATVLALARSLVRPGGTVVVFELPGDPPGTFGPLFDLMMRVETPGRARRVSELVQLLHAAGLSDVVRTEHALPHAVLVARLPSPAGA